MKKVLFILGPTGVGKSEVGIKLAQIFNGEIISADSVQVFRELNIGSAKVSEKEMGNIKHHAIDILPPQAKFSVFEFVKLTKDLIEQISAKGKNPIIVGGTGLYVKALTEGYDFGGESVSQQSREDLDKMTNEELANLLKSLNPEILNKIDLNNKRRLVRAVEIAREGKKVSKNKCEYDFLVLALVQPREQLYKKINDRVDLMIKKGLVEEVKGLREKGLTLENQSMSAIGYKEIYNYLEGQCTLEDAVNLIKQHTRNYAKRQITFMKGLQCEFMARDDENAIIKRVEEFYDDSRT